ncbi:MAG: hypothetical protein M0Z95_02155, partial [Actinomycetota bacterium]|nr:hypothetical protein [Actinomycetota bacterium]
MAGGSELGRTPTGVVVSGGVADDGVRVDDRIVLGRARVVLHVVGLARTSLYRRARHKDELVDQCLERAFGPVSASRRARRGVPPVAPPAE